MRSLHFDHVPVAFVASEHRFLSETESVDSSTLLSAHILCKASRVHWHRTSPASHYTADMLWLCGHVLGGSLTLSVLVRGHYWALVVVGDLGRLSFCARRRFRYAALMSWNIVGVQGGREETGSGVSKKPNCLCTSAAACASSPEHQRMLKIERLINHHFHNPDLGTKR